jgi:HAD superfamily hydrolase (TIGR01509 family)
MGAVLFGSIGAVADTSEVQRESFNEAFAEHGLDWTWERDEYREMLKLNGGPNRVHMYAKSRGEQVDTAALHATKTRIFREKLAAGGISPRPGVAETIAEAREQGMKLALVTTTSHGNVAALAAALKPAVDIDGFDLVVDAGSVERRKPAPDAYRFALARLDEDAAECVAVEDNVGGVDAAIAADLACVAFPGENNADHDFRRAEQVVQKLSLDELRSALARV